MGYEIKNKNSEYRVIKHIASYYDILDGYPPYWFSVQEVYYDKDNNIESHTFDLTIESPTLKELKKELNKMIDSLNEVSINEIVDENNTGSCGYE
jgi:hypothetical protein